MLMRAVTFLFAVLAVAVSAVAAWDVFRHGRLTVLDPLLLAAIGVVGAAILFHGLIAARDQARDLAARTDRLTALTAELESFIAALEAANTRLEASEARYKGLVDAQGDTILRRTPDGRMTYANEAFCRLFGVRRGEIVGQMFHPEPHPESTPPMFGRLAGREVGREHVSYDQHIKTVAGYRWIAWEDYPIRGADGALLEIQSVGRDITERKSLEAALIEARDHAEEANRAKSRFLATMSHEIRTPMNGVLGMARLLGETPLAPDQKTYAEAIRQSGLALLALIEDILDFAKIESGALAIEENDVALRPLIEGVAELLFPRAHAKGIEIATAIAADVPDIVRTDGIRIRQIVTNLVGNAVKFTEEGGVLVSATVESGLQGGGLTLSLTVRDTGIGVPPDKQAHIFEDFVQADSSQARRYEGTGLGLAISKRLVEAMGGSIGVGAAGDRGSVFWAHLPLADAGLRVPPRPLKHKRIALVSCSTVVRDALRLQLESAGAFVTEARSLEAIASKGRCDALLIDALADEPVFPDVNALSIPAVALLPAGRRAPLDVLGAKAIGGYLLKPVRQDSLEKRLTAVMRGESELALAPAAPEIPPEHSGALRILLAEDNPVNALLARELLRRRGHRVHEVTTGEGAVAACAAERFDIVIMDLHMPRLDGVEATRRIRLAECAHGGKRVPIFALTADALEAGRKACLEAGMDGFLTKPVDPAELDAVLATINPPACVAAE
jgi:PAS domain S-box-containing protein